MGISRSGLMESLQRTLKSLISPNSLRAPHAKEPSPHGAAGQSLQLEFPFKESTWGLGFRGLGFRVRMVTSLGIFQGGLFLESPVRWILDSTDAPKLPVQSLVNKSPAFWGKLSFGVLETRRHRRPKGTMKSTP